jgi:O-antigen/teichoic acid export membrane protein
MSFTRKIFSSFKNIHFQSLIGTGVMSVLGMITYAVLYRALSIQNFGSYAFFMTLFGFIDTLRSGFLTTTYIKFYSGTSKERSLDVAGSSWVIALLITGISIIVTTVVYFLPLRINNEGLTLFLQYFPIVSIVTLPSFMANLAIQGDKRFDKLLWLRFFQPVSYIAIIAALIILKKSDLQNIIMAYIISNIIAGVMVFLLRWTMIGAIVKFSAKTIVELFHFGKYSVGTSLSSTLFGVTDTFFINFYLGAPALAIYNVGGKLLQIVEMPLQSFAASNMPNLSSHYNNDHKEKMMYVMKKMIGMLTIIIFFLAILSNIFAEPIILLISGKKYLHTEAPNLFRIFMIIAILYPTDRFFALTLDVIHKPQINLLKIFVMLFINLVGDYVGVTFFKSIYAVALVNVIPFLAAIIIAYIPLNKHYKFSIKDMYVVGYRELIFLIKGIKLKFFSPAS